MFALRTPTGWQSEVEVAVGKSGAVYVNSSTLTMKNSKFELNYSNGLGGASKRSGFEKTPRGSITVVKKSSSFAKHTRGIVM